MRTTVQKQLWIFFDQNIVTDFLKISSEMKEVFWDNVWINLNDQKWLPPEIPRLEMTYDWGAIVFALNRCDLYIKWDTSSNIVEDYYLKFWKIIEDIWVTIDWLWFVSTSFMPQDIKESRKLINVWEKFKDNEIRDIGISINVLTKVLDYTCNNIENVKFWVLWKDEWGKLTEERWLLVHKDINTRNTPMRISEDIWEKIIEFMKEINNIKDDLFILDA